MLRRSNAVNTGLSKLTDEQVRTIRQRYVARSKEHCIRVLAQDFGVACSTIHDVITRKSHRNVSRK